MASGTVVGSGDEKISLSGVAVNDENTEKPTTVVTDEEDEVILRKIDFQ
jgi:hypothetical protein